MHVELTRYALYVLQVGFASGAVDLHFLDASIAGRPNEDPMTEAAQLEEALGIQ